MKHLSRMIILLLLLSLTACGANIYIDGVRLDFPDESSSPAPSSTLAPTATATATASPTLAPTQELGLLATTNANVNLRTIPSTANNTPIRVLFTGTRIRLLERLPDNTWARTSEGWVYTQNLTISGNINSLPVYQPIDPTPTREGAKARVSYNINGEAVPDSRYLMEVMTSPCKSMALVMNSLGLASQIKQACPDTIVVSRNYSSLEGDQWALESPQVMVARWVSEGHKEIVRHSTNEPSFGRGRRLEEFVAKEIELMRLAREAGFTVAMGNFSVGIFEPEDINNGFFDHYIRALELYGHYLGLHEYAVAALPFGVGQWQTLWLQDRNRVQPALWPSVHALPTRLWSGQLPPYWYLRRGDWFLLRADYLGVARPRILLTEFGWDNLPNIKPDIEILRQQFGLPQYFNDMRGVNTYPRLWAWYWPQWTFAEAACQQLIWADSVYPEEYLGFALFTWSWYERSAWLQTDFSGRENGSHYALHQCLESYAYSLPQ